jgi:CHAT domain-containing protein
MTKLCLIFFFICGITFSQNLEEAIYNAAENFIENQNEASLKLLNIQEKAFKNQITTKDEQLALVFLQCHKGYYLSQSGNLKQAITTYEDASKSYLNNDLSKLSDFDITESCLKPLGNLYTKTGDYTNAISTINQYIYLAKQTKNKQHEISGAINLAILYQTLGNHKMALKVTNDYIDASKFSKNQQQKLIQINIDSQMALGIISNYNDVPKALDDHAKYKLAFDKGNYDEALNYLEKTETSALKNNPIMARDVAKIYFQEAQIHYLLKHNVEAENRLQKALKILLPEFSNNSLPAKESLYAENTFIDIFDLYASLQTNFETALLCLDLSFYVSSLLQNNWTSQENKLQNQAANRLRSETCIDILFNQYKLTKNKDYIAQAFQYAENNKASVLKEISQKKIQLQQHPNDSLLIAEFNLLKEQERLTSLLVKEQLGASNASKINNLSIALNSISIELKALKPVISKKYPSTNAAVSIKKLQEKLKQDQAVLVTYFYGKNGLYQFIISENHTSIFNINLTETLRKNISEYIHFFDNASVINNDITAFTKRSHQLYKDLNFGAVKTYKTVIVIPDSFLNFIPFESLLTTETKTTSFSKMPFVVTNQTLVYNSSSQFYLTSNKPTENSKLLGVFPVFETSEQPLTFTLNEAEAIENEMDAKLLLKKEATKQHFIENAKNYNILHLSTHASSGNFVVPANIQFYDDTLFLNELYSLNLNSNLVVLSACETGIGELYKGEGPMSIARGFQYAGAENLLFSLWQINDLSTSQIMQSFYKNYHKNESAFMSNHLSKINYLQDDAISNTKKSPYYWSAFVYFGSIEPVKTSNTSFYIIFGIIILLLTVFLLLKLKNYGRNTSEIPNK